ncbi:hypothetical protein JYB62_19370 [Algoriphagus lutimaris]|uniref:hypothetical protein n=1 Tax=Algoriphagus lutimaris TaxID=613197 RepID=UPI00196B4BAC|nr:hypothetical protein [Algoriphagus lutimaris]MBN3522172.1 hypothetical protein [Algoriphagus lutimaris]
MKDFFKGNSERFKWILVFLIGTGFIQLNAQFDIILICWEFFKSNISVYSIGKYLG